MNAPGHTRHAGHRAHFNRTGSSPSHSGNLLAPANQNNDADAPFSTHPEALCVPRSCRIMIMFGFGLNEVPDPECPLL